MDQPYLGEIAIVAFDFTPRGFVGCNGQLMPIAQNQALFALLGTTYGGNGVQTFGLPDFRGRLPVGAGQGPGLQNYVLGEKSGEEIHTLISSEMPQHNHLPLAYSGAGNAALANNTLWSAANNADLIYSNAAGNSNMINGSIGVSGSNQPHENRMPILTLNFIIATVGIFPTRN
jgi:microcystin-dependent protein